MIVVVLFGVVVISGGFSWERVSVLTCARVSESVNSHGDHWYLPQVSIAMYVG